MICFFWSKVTALWKVWGHFKMVRKEMGLCCNEDINVYNSRISSSCSMQSGFCSLIFSKLIFSWNPLCAPDCGYGDRSGIEVFYRETVDWLIDWLIDWVNKFCSESGFKQIPCECVGCQPDAMQSVRLRGREGPPPPPCNLWLSSTAENSRDWSTCQKRRLHSLPIMGAHPTLKMTFADCATAACCCCCCCCCCVVAAAAAAVIIIISIVFSFVRRAEYSSASTGWFISLYSIARLFN